MKLAELFPPGSPQASEPTPHWRRAWGERAFVTFDRYMGARIFGNGLSGPYAVTFDDLMADDWDLVPAEKMTATDSVLVPRGTIDFSEN